MHVGPNSNGKEDVWFNTQNYIMKVEVQPTGVPNYKLWQYVSDTAAPSCNIASGLYCPTRTNSYLLSMQKPSSSSMSLYILSLLGLSHTSTGDKH